MFASGVVFSMKAWILSAHEVYLGLRFSQHERQTHAAAQPAATPGLKGELTEQKSRVGHGCLSTSEKT